MSNTDETLNMFEKFSTRHIGPRDEDLNAMAQVCGYSDWKKLVDNTVPKTIRLKQELDLPGATTEAGVYSELKHIAEQNQVFKTYIGMGYYGTTTPAVIRRNILENPGWYTQYTPYQAEISQGRLEALLNFQTMISELTGLPVANASLLDEATAAAEAMALCFAAKDKGEQKAFFVSHLCHPQTISVIQTRAEPLGIHVVVGDHTSYDFRDSVVGALVQYPDTRGTVNDYSAFAKKVHEQGALLVVAADLLALAMLKTPADFGADIAVGSAQRFGVPMGYGGPHAAYFAVKDELKRLAPGRIIGVSQDAHGRKGYRLALQTREQHIRREKATSNICTAQALLAIMASMYAVYHGPEGLKKIAERVHAFTHALANGLKKAGFTLASGEAIFDTLTLQVKDPAQWTSRAEAKKINLRRLGSDQIGISLDETTTRDDVQELLELFGVADRIGTGLVVAPAIQGLLRKDPCLQHEIFKMYRSETEMLRYIRRLESRDLSLCHSMIPLGSCTMKLNASSEMLPITWEPFALLHPFAPEKQTQGYRTLFKQLEGMLSEITGFAGVSLQPNAGSQGEYAGLLVIREYLKSKGQKNRNICLIPKSAHGTNPASAVMAGFKVVVVDCDLEGNIDLADLKKKSEEYRDTVGVLMVTYPSTHGVFEEGIREICDQIHRVGGQVYMDGANMNAQVALCRPGDFGPDVCHLNLHKTFCIPHGGGGPGMGPIGVAKHLVPFLPGHPVVKMGGSQAIGPVSAAPWGSASILPISWVYVRLMGTEGLKKATEAAIVNANYIAKKLEPHFPVLYKGKTGLVAHECIVDMRKLKETAGVEVEDIAKRLMDYGFHAPTISFPVPGTMMIEPTESESREELDRFCEAMVSIREEIREIESGKMDRANNPLKNAPHTATEIASSDWKHAYSRERAVFPLAWTRASKFWPPVSRVNNVLGDRNLICVCPPVEAYLTT